MYTHKQCFISLKINSGQVSFYCLCLDRQKQRVISVCSIITMCYDMKYLSLYGDEVDVILFSVIFGKTQMQMDYITMEKRNACDVLRTHFPGKFCDDQTCYSAKIYSVPTALNVEKLTHKEST